MKEVKLTYRKEKRERLKRAKKLLKHSESSFLKIDLSGMKNIPDGMTIAYRNNRYTVMIFENEKVTTGIATRAMIQKHDDKPLNKHWAEMQAIKNAFFGTDAVAVEYYPSEKTLINDHNIYWMWIFPEGVLPMPVL